MSIVGSEGVVECHDRVLLNSVGIGNDVGGSSELPLGRYRVRVVRAWGDYEIGGRAEGVLLDETDIALARTTGTTGYDPENYRQYGEDSEAYLGAVAAKRAFDPARVFFALEDFTVK